MSKKREKIHRLSNTPSISPLKWVQKDMPSYDYIAKRNLNNQGDLEWLLQDFIHDMENDYFLRWEAVVCSEQGLPLTKKQENVLSSLISFNEETDRISYINELPRPSQAWHEILSKFVPHLLLKRFKTSDIHFAVTTEGWPNLVRCLKEYGKDLSLPKEVKVPIDIIPKNIQHGLWLQSCFDELSGLGQEIGLNLSEPDQQYRIEGFIDLLKKHKDSIEFLDLTLEKLSKILILPFEDEKIFLLSLKEKLELVSTQVRIVEHL